MPFIKIDQYRELFSGDRGIEALKYAHDIRMFEINLYWKRAAYFWTFIAAAFAGYFAIQKEGDASSIFIVSCLGFTFSLGWYFVNRGSGAWQRNWEAHVDLLEDKITGPLHKTLINRRSYNLKDLAEPYSFSPSRINNILAFYVVAIWLFLIVRSLWRALKYFPISIKLPTSPMAHITVLTVAMLTVFASAVLFCKGRSRRDRSARKDIKIWLRSYYFSNSPLQSTKMRSQRRVWARFRRLRRRAASR